jgi:glycosyltransferase involved in cell wall biosynthesis
VKILAAVFNEIDYDGRVQRAAEALSELGDVVVVSPSSGFAFHNGRFQNLRIHIGRPRSLKFLSHLRFWFALCWHAVRTRPDVVHAHDFFMAFPGWLAARLARAAFVYDAHELIIPDADLDSSKRDVFWYSLEAWAVHRADVVIAANRERALLMACHYGLPSIPLVVRNVPSSPQPSLSQRDVTTRFPFLARPPQDAVLVAYQGVLKLQEIAVWVQSFTHLPATFRLVLIGAGAGKSELRDLVARLGLQDRVFFTERVPRAHLNDILKCCHVGIVSYPFHGLNSLHCASNKLFEYAQAGLVIVGTSQPPIRRELERHQIGLLVNEEDGPERIAAVLQEAADGREHYRRGLGPFLSAHRWEDEAGKLIDGIRGLHRRGIRNPHS